jgi:hypothetical protein
MMEQSIERQLVEAKVLPQLASLTEQTEAAREAADKLPVSEAFNLVRDLAVLNFGDNSADVNAPTIIQYLTDWAEAASVGVDRTSGDEAAGFLASAVTTLAEGLTADEVKAIGEAVDAWKQTAPKGKRAKGSGQSKGKGLVWRSKCHTCGNEYEDRDSRNSARWSLQGHMVNAHGWPRRWQRADGAGYDTLTNAWVGEAEEVTVTDPDGKGSYGFTLWVDDETPAAAESTDTESTEAA